MPYSPHPTSDIIYRLINASPVGTGEQLLDSLGTLKEISKECYYNLDIDNPIEIFLTFTDLEVWEKEKFAPWICNEKFLVGREITCKNDDFEDEYIAIVKLPEPEWLREDEINGQKINEWWSNKKQLVINNLDFSTELGGTKPSVARWKEIANTFINDHAEEINWAYIKKPNPKGYKGVLKGNLPNIVLVPAVRDITQETKVTQSNPFGKLINSVLEKIPNGKKKTISDQFKEI